MNVNAARLPTPPRTDASRGQLARGLEVCGDHWTLVIVHEIGTGTTRFGGLHRALGISRTVLNSRLQNLLAEGIVERHEYRPSKGWADYQLTARGFALYPVISALINFANQHLALPEV